MTYRKLQVVMFAASGLLTSAAYEGLASADVGAAQVTRLLSPSQDDLAPTTGNPPRLRRTDEEQPGAEMAHLAFFADGKSGLYFEMRSSDINGQLPNDREQCAMVPFHLAQNPDGSVAAVADLAGARFITDNRGNEERNCNHPSAYEINGGTAIAVEYNYQPNNGNDTKRYMMVFDKSGKTIMPQTQIYAKNNDDCSMNQDDTSTTTVSASPDGSTQLLAWRGCNGNGQDDGWLQSFAVTCDSATSPTSCSFKKQFDVSLCQREERSHGKCTVGTDPNTAICSWTEGNNQPQRDGVWMAAVDITPGTTGTDRQDKILWKQMVDGKHGSGDTRTYSQRAMQERVMTVDATGHMVPTDDIIWRHGAAQGNNNGNNGKGGTYYGNIMGVITATKAGMTYKMPLNDMQSNLLGLDGTHLGMSYAMFGTTDHLMPGLIFIGGSQTGGGYAAKVRAVGWDQTANTFKDLGSYSIAPYDRHLYSNYLGNNPGNQGRNYSGARLIANPFVGMNGNKDAYLLVTTTTGKDPSDIMTPQLKLSSYVTVMPISQTPSASENPPGPGSGSGSGSNPGSGSGSNPNPDPNGGVDPGSSFGGCSAGSSSSGGATLLLIGLAAFIRRRR
jgi:MYXO-CTERM domain-containing protein